MDDEHQKDPSKGGRPTEYRPEYARIAGAMASLGATEVELAQEFGVSTVTIWAWKRAHPEFLNATRIGREAADDRMEASLYQRGIGYSHEAEKILVVDKQVVREKYVEHYPPDTTAGVFWLKNRRPHLWRDTAMREDNDSNQIRVHGGLPKAPTEDDA